MAIGNCTCHLLPFDFARLVPLNGMLLLSKNMHIGTETGWDLRSNIYEHVKTVTCTSSPSHLSSMEMKLAIHFTSSETQAARYADLGQWIVWSQEYHVRGFSQLHSSDQGWGLPINCEVRIFPSPLGASLSLISKITFRRRAGIPSFAVRFIRWHISVLVVFGGWWRMVEV